jgi:hypothetical protein
VSESLTGVGCARYRHSRQHPRKREAHTRLMYAIRRVSEWAARSQQASVLPVAQPSPGPLHVFFFVLSRYCISLLLVLLFQGAVVEHDAEGLCRSCRATYACDDCAAEQIQGSDCWRLGDSDLTFSDTPTLTSLHFGLKADVSSRYSNKYIHLFNILHLSHACAQSFFRTAMCPRKL